MKNWSLRGNKGERNDGVVNVAPNRKLKKTDHGEVEVSHLEPLNKATRWIPNRFANIPQSKVGSGRRKHRRGNPSGY